MRALLIALAALFALAPPALAAPRLAGQTHHALMPSHGQQIEYLAADGRNYLWYSASTKVLAGEWKLEGSDICFRYAWNSYNPTSRRRNGEWGCQPLEIYSRAILKSVPGDHFGLAGRNKAPFELTAHFLYFNQIEAIADPSIVARGLAKLPGCEQVLADAEKNRDAKSLAALVYYHGKWMGKSCVKVDYLRALEMLREIGDTDGHASLVKNLQDKASTGNPRAVAALDQLRRAGHID